MIVRLLDIVVSFFVLIFLFPLMLLVVVAIKLDSKGPAIFMQDRVGLYGKIFRIYKFRSMVVDAQNQGPYYTSAGDSRITKVGRVIRKTSIDEFPQLVNVLIGDMSLVGPRPNVPRQREEYSESEWEKRNSIRPGITGLAQAKLRSAATAEQRKNLDFEYVDNASLRLNLEIILLTFKQVLFKGGN